MNLATISFVDGRFYKNLLFLGLFYIIFRVVAMQSSVHYTKRAKNILHIAYHSEYHETSFCSLNGMCVCECVYTVHMKTQRTWTMRFDAIHRFAKQMAQMSVQQNQNNDVDNSMYASELNFFGSPSLTPSSRNIHYSCEHELSF